MKKLIFTIIGFIAGLMTGIYAMLKFLASCPKELNDLKKQFIDKIEFLLLGYNTVKKRNICYSNYRYDPQMEQGYIRGQRYAYNRYGNRYGKSYEDPEDFKGDCSDCKFGNRRLAEVPCNTCDESFSNFIMKDKVSGNYYCGSLDHLKKNLADALANREEDKND